MFGGDPGIGFSRLPSPRGDRGQQAHRVRVPWVLEDVVDVADLGAAARVEHAHPSRETGDDTEVVGDEDDRGLRHLLHLLDDLEDLGLDGHVERGGRLVRDQHLGVVADRHRDHRPLAHAARELVRVLVGACGGLRDADEVEHLDRASLRLVARDLLVCAHGFGDLIADLQHRVQRGQRILEDHRELRAAVVADVVLVEPEQLFSRGTSPNR